MATATNRRYKRRWITPIEVLLAVGAGLLLLGIGVASHTGAEASHSGAGAGAGAGTVSAGTPALTMGTLRSAPAPRGWRVARLPSHLATLAYPPGWRAIETDRGTFSAARTERDGLIVSYLNLTPRSGAETLANWTHFRPRHVSMDGGRHVRLLAAASGLSLGGGEGSCVIDSYSTSRTSYREIACLVIGAHAGTVVVGAAQSAAWAEQAPTDRARGREHRDLSSLCAGYRGLLEGTPRRPPGSRRRGARDRDGSAAERASGGCMQCSSPAGLGTSMK